MEFIIPFFILIFAEADPNTATCIDNDCCLPLHNAIASGKGWNDGIKALIAAAPVTLEIRDGIHHLPPFLLAAMCEVNSLNVVYSLLLASPTVVRDGIYSVCECHQ